MGNVLYFLHIKVCGTMEQKLRTLMSLCHERYVIMFANKEDTEIKFRVKRLLMKRYLRLVMYNFHRLFRKKIKINGKRRWNLII